MRNKKLILVGLILGSVMAAMPAESAVFNPAGQAVKVLYANHSSLLNSVIAATEIGVRSTTTGRTATGWGVSKFAGSAMGPLLTIAVSAAGIAWTPLIEPWLESHGWWFENGGVVEESGTGHYMPVSGASGVGSMGYVQNSPVANTSVSVQLYPTSGDAQAMDCSGGTSNCLYDDPGLYANGWNSSLWSRQKCCWFGNYPSETGKIAVYPKYDPNQVEWVPGDPVTVSDGTVESAFIADYGNEAAGAPGVAVALVDYLGGLVGLANHAWPSVVPDVAGYSPLSTAQGDAVQTAFNDAIDPQAKADLQDSADANGTMVPGGSVEGPTGKDWEYTPEQMATAQYERDTQLDADRLQAFRDAGGDDNASDNDTVSDNYTIPDRKDLAALLLSYSTSMAALPIVSVVQNSGVTVSGAISYIDLPKPEMMGGGTIRVDFADYEDWLIAFGNLLYAFVGFHWLMWLFMGRGDA